MARPERKTSPDTFRFTSEMALRLAELRERAGLSQAEVSQATVAFFVSDQAGELD